MHNAGALLCSQFWTRIKHEQANSLGSDSTLFSTVRHSGIAIPPSHIDNQFIDPSCVPNPQYPPTGSQSRRSERAITAAGGKKCSLPLLHLAPLLRQRGGGRNHGILRFLKNIFSRPPVTRPLSLPHRWGLRTACWFKSPCRAAGERVAAARPKKVSHQKGR